MSSPSAAEEAVSEHHDAFAWAQAQVIAARDDPAARLALLRPDRLAPRTCRGRAVSSDA